MPYDAVLELADAFRPVAEVRAVLLSETGAESADGIEVVRVPVGTKLSKVRRIVDIVRTDLYVICDPDMKFDAPSCRAVLLQAIDEFRRGRSEVIAFGLVETDEVGSLVSRAVAVDKWVSHRVLRRALWAHGIGITLPGQFLVASHDVLRAVDPRVDTYLDDLYLGLIARQRHCRVHRTAAIIGKEGTRNSWLSLVSQRCRWMKGFVSLVAHTRGSPSAAALMAIHYLSYHAVPIALMAAILALGMAHPTAGVSAFGVVAVLLWAASRRSLVAVLAFLCVFPVVHLIASVFWWVPVSRTALLKR